MALQHNDNPRGVSACIEMSFLWAFQPTKPAMIQAMPTYSSHTFVMTL